jgi:hypothetical protein
MNTRTAVLAASLLLGAAIHAAHPRDLGQWENADPELSRWYKALRQPDNPGISCCGESDAYFADSFEVAGDQYVAIITDTRPDEPLKRPHIAPGTRVVIPNSKLKFDQGNPTGHGVVFMRPDGTVFCYVPPGGV